MEYKKVKLNMGDEKSTSFDIPAKHFMAFKEFHENYELEKMLLGNKPEILGGKIPKDKRKCRFCKRSFPDVSFNNKSHVITQQLNRALPISSFECDNCNDKFKTYESDFGHFFLIERSMFGSKRKKKGSPKFKTDMGTQIFGIDDLDNFDFQSNDGEKFKEFIRSNDLSLILMRQGKDESEINLGEKKTILNLKVKPYRPFNVYRTLLKMGLSLIDEKDLKNFKQLFHYLNAEVKIHPEEEFKTQIFYLNMYQIPLYKNVYPNPLLQLYKNKSSNDNELSKNLILFFNNYMLQIFLPSDKNFKYMFGEGKNTIYPNKFSPYFNFLLPFNPFHQKELKEALENYKEQGFNLFRSELVTNEIRKYEITQPSGFTKLE